MGTLTNFLGDDEETIGKTFKPATEDTLNNNGASAFGVPFPLELPQQELLSAQASAAASSEELKIFPEAYAKTILAIDEALPPGIKLPPIFDPTFAIPFEPFFEFLIEIGIENPIEWVEANLPAMLELDIGLLAACKTEEFAEELNKIDSSIDVDEAAAAGEKICGFTMPSFTPPVFNFTLPDFTLGLLPIELFLPPNFTLPQVSLAITLTLEAFILAISQLLRDIQALIEEIIRGIPSFIIFLIEYIFQLILQAILAALEPLLKGILFVAELITYIVKVTAAFIVALVGHIIGDGIVTILVAEKLGLAN
jgi:hypothetical protein